MMIQLDIRRRLSLIKIRRSLFIHTFNPLNLARLLCLKKYTVSQCFNLKQEK